MNIKDMMPSPHDIMVYREQHGCGMAEAKKALLRQRLISRLDSRFTDYTVEDLQEVLVAILKGDV